MGRSHSSHKHVDLLACDLAEFGALCAEFLERNSYQTPMSSINIIIREAKVPGFFDMEALASPMHTTIVNERRKVAADETEKEFEAGVKRTFSRKVYLVRDNVVDKFLASRPWLTKDHVLKRHGTAPFGMHADLLTDFATCVFPTHDLCIDQDKLDNIRSHAQSMPTSAEGVRMSKEIGRVDDSISLDDFKSTVRFARAGQHAGYASILDVLKKTYNGLVAPSYAFATIRKAHKVKVVDAVFKNLGIRTQRATPAANLDQMIKIVKACNNAVDEERRAQIVRNLRALLGSSSTGDTVSEGAVVACIHDDDVYASTSTQMTNQSSEDDDVQLNNPPADIQDGAIVPSDLLTSREKVIEDPGDNHIQSLQSPTPSGSGSYKIVLHASDFEPDHFLLRPLYDALPTQKRKRNSWQNARTKFIEMYDGPFFKDGWRVPVTTVRLALIVLCKDDSNFVDSVSFDMRLVDAARKRGEFRPVAVTRDDVVANSARQGNMPNYQQVMNSIRRVSAVQSINAERPGIEGHGSVRDVVQLVTGCEAIYLSQHVDRVCIQLERNNGSNTDCVRPIFQMFSFNGQDTPIAPLKTLLLVVQALPGNNALNFQTHCMEQLCRVFAGDPNLKPELEENMRNMRPEDRRDMLIDVPRAAPVACDQVEECKPGSGLDVGRVLCSRALCIRDIIGDLDIDRLPLVPVPGLESVPFDTNCVEHGAYLFLFGMATINGIPILDIKPGASFFGSDGMKGRFDPIRRKNPTSSCVMFKVVMDAPLARVSETNMKVKLESMGNACQVGTTERWIVTLPIGADPANAARDLSSQLCACLPSVTPSLPTVPEAVERAFKIATDAANAVGAGDVKASLSESDGGHRFHVETLDSAQAMDLAKHRLDARTKQVQQENETQRERTRAQLELLKTMVERGYAVDDIIKLQDKCAKF